MLDRRLAMWVKRFQTTVDALRYAAVLLFGNAPLPTTALIILSLAAGLATPLIVWSINGLIDAVAVSSGPPWRAVAPWILVLSIAFLIRSVEDAGSRYVSAVIREHVDGAIHDALHIHAIRVPLEAFESKEYYTKIENGRRAIGGHLVYVLDALSALLAAGVGVIGLMALYAQAHWSIVIVLIITVVMRSIVGARQSKAFVDVNYGSSPLRREFGYWGSLLSNRQAAPEMRLFNLGPHIVGKWQDAFDRFFSEITAARYRLALGELVSGSIQELIGWSTALVLIVLAMAGGISVGSLVALLYGVGRFRTLVGTFSWTVSELVLHWEHFRHLREFLALPAEARELPTMPAPRPINRGVRFENVTFVYPGSESPSLKEINLELRPGERVALVGENGAGKTTLVRLLLGLYHPVEGRITVDGIDLDAIDPDNWRREATAVFQDFVRYPLSVLENVGFGDVSLLSGRDHTGEVHPRILEAITKSGSDALVRTLSDGFHTLLGKEFEGGVELSAGQWQRLALARAYVRNAQIVVLDEPTAALDPRAEVEVYRQFREVAAGRCTLFISHRLGSARLADRVVVLRDGRIVEDGTHQSLLDAEGEYARMYRLQAGWYSDEEGVAAG